jgi:nucleotide-binding universal stress UspA family protein
MKQSDGAGPRLAIFADDGAPASDVAWSWLISHHWAGWQLTVLTVHETLVPGGRTYSDAKAVPRHAPAEAGFVAVDHVERDGDQRTILHSREDASLLVLGCHHRGHLAGMWAGSTTEWLLVRPPRPLAIARHGHQTRSVAVCVDGSADAQYALEAFLSLPWSGEVQVSLVAVADGATDVEAALAAARAAFPATSRPHEAYMVGAPKKEITRFVHEHGTDLVVLGTRGLTGLKRMTAGSTVSALVKDETANLLVAHQIESPGSSRD